MGALGYSHASLMGWIMSNAEPNQTYEGDNHVLLQQVAKFLMKGVKEFKKSNTVGETLEFLTSRSILEIHEFSSETLTALTHQRARELVLKIGSDLINQPDQWESMQYLYVKEMCEAYYDSYLATTFTQFLSGIKDTNVRNLFAKLYLVFLKTTVIKDGFYFKDILSSA